VSLEGRRKNPAKELEISVGGGYKPCLRGELGGVPEREKGDAMPGHEGQINEIPVTSQGIESMSLGGDFEQRHRSEANQESNERERGKSMSRSYRGEKFIFNSGCKDRE